ncbi:MAG: Ig-like domain-containing protein [Clostridiales bacterium]|jgi:hypothetical protein|nr:Ig-like domain-containing protein [Clostridiales bacterium]
MKKRFIVIFLVIAVALCFTGCKNGNETGGTSPSPETNLPSPSGQSPATTNFGTGAPIEVWEAVHGSFVREDSSQYNNAVLMAKYLSDDCAMFEFRLMEGSEAEGEAHDTVICGVLIVDDSGTGFYETLPDAGNPFTINFNLSEDGQSVSITHTGELEISPDGVYNFTDAGLEVSDLSANAIIEHLPTAATSLNSNLGAYTVNYPDALVADWFYIVEAVFDDSGAVLAKFAIAKDLSAVFRIDDDIEPILIFGSAQPMMDAETYIYPEYEYFEEIGEDESIGERPFEPSPVAAVGLEDGVTMVAGSTNQLIASLPWELPHYITAESTDETVAVVDENGVVTAIAAGEATIFGTLSIEDGVKEFSIEIFVQD